MQQGRYPEIAASIKAARRRKGLSQERAADLVGCTRLQWIRWEQGLHRPMEYAARLAEVLGIPEDELGVEDDDEEAALYEPLSRAVQEIVRSEIARKLGATG